MIDANHQSYCQPFISKYMVSISSLFRTKNTWIYCCELIGAKPSLANCLDKSFVTGNVSGLPETCCPNHLTETTNSPSWLTINEKVSPLRETSIGFSFLLTLTKNSFSSENPQIPQLMQPPGWRLVREDNNCRWKLFGLPLEKALKNLSFFILCMVRLY